MSCSVTAKQIDAVLPQTQCGLCGYAGCMPYAEALSKGEATINLCPPGGVKGLKAIAELVQQDPTPFIEDMEQKAKPKMVARIREADCIGCTKCIVACPVDAILGGAKEMHVILAAECTGCELCVVPCPVDCIEMVGVAELSETEEKMKADLARRRFVERNARIEIDSVEMLRPPPPALRADLSHEGRGEKVLADKKDFIREALERAQKKKMKN